MPKIDVNKVELVWPGKHNDDGSLKEVPRVHLPFQVIETINEGRASREAAKKPETMSLFDVYEGKEGDTFEEGWTNKLIWGDNLLVMGSLLEKFAGKVDLIYIDPPFATGADFSFTAPIGELGEAAFKEQSVIEEKAYRDSWGKGLDSYLTMMSSRLQLMKELLSERGTVFVHCDYRVDGFVRMMLHETFSAETFRSKLIWKKDAVGKGAKKIARHWARTFDEVFVYSKTSSPIFNPVFADLGPKQLAEFRYQDPDGRKFKRTTLGDYAQASIEKMEADGYIYVSSSGQKYKKYYLDEYTLLMDSIFTDVPGFGVASSSRERLGYDTQKPEALLDRIVRSASDDGSLVADFFCGSGTTLAVAEKLGRQWIGCDLGRWAIHVTRKRLLGIENCKPFDLLNLGRYERRYWAGVTFGDKKSDDQLTIYEYLAFILKLYGAQPLSGTQHLHGKKGRAMVHVVRSTLPSRSTRSMPASRNALQ